MEGDGHRGRHGAEIHNAAAAPAAHGGNDRPVHTHHAEEIHLKLALGLLRVRKLHSTADAEARIIHQDVNMPGLLQNLLHRPADGLLVRHIGPDVLKALHAPFTAAQLIHRAAVFCQVQSRFPANAGGPAGDNSDLTHEAAPPP